MKFTVEYSTPLFRKGKQFITVEADSIEDANQKVMRTVYNPSIKRVIAK